MEMDVHKPIIGILGGPASGKSTVAGEFARLGCGLVDADVEVGRLLEDGDIKEQIRRAFGQGVFDNDGRINRDRLAEQVFESKANVDRINGIIHPPVLARCEQLIAEYNSDSGIKAIVLDIPLLVEVGWAESCDKLVFVACDYQIRACRAGEKGGFYKKQLKKRENFQISLDKKAKIADYMLSNNSGLAAMAEQVVRVFTIINS